MYSNKFLKAFDYLMYHEGGYVNDPKDAGRETKYGISKLSYPKLDIKNLTLDQARQIYFVDFWMKAKCESINDQNVATKFFDLTVHAGIPQAAKLIQRALRAAGTQVVEDGIIGPITLFAINKVDPTDLLAAFFSDATTGKINLSLMGIAGGKYMGYDQKVLWFCGCCKRGRAMR
jgi:lysozyme family protein